MTDLELQRDLGRLEGQVEALVDAVDDMKRDFKERLDAVDEKIDSMNAIVQRAGGGLKMLLMVAAFSSFVSGMLVKFLPFFQAK